MSSLWKWTEKLWNIDQLTKLAQFFSDLFVALNEIYFSFLAPQVRWPMHSREVVLWGTPSFCRLAVWKRNETGLLPPYSFYKQPYFSATACLLGRSLAEPISVPSSLLDLANCWVKESQVSVNPLSLFQVKPMPARWGRFFLLSMNEAQIRESQV